MYNYLLLSPLPAPQYENKVAVRDRVAFACKFLGDAQVRTDSNLYLR